MLREKTDLDIEHKTASCRQVDLVEWRRSRGREILRSTHWCWTVIREDIGDVFAVEEVIDAETDLRLIEYPVSCVEGVVKEQIDVIIRSNMHLVVVGTIVVVVAAHALLNNPKVETAALVRYA